MPIQQEYQSWQARQQDSDQTAIGKKLRSAIANWGWAPKDIFSFLFYSSDELHRILQLTLNGLTQEKFRTIVRLAGIQRQLLISCLTRLWPSIVLLA
jgi:hypothetical protein